ncbi:nitroreductase family protein [Nocardioidaceae bacterium SCSIO 66511]|nr:nitroreductase family protein [Nocardioidaceae bacterium SCSIO 66511]
MRNTSATLPAGQVVTDHPMPRADLHALLRTRFSPLRFDDHHILEPDDIELLLEAARWAPSAGNSQPWAFVTALRGDADHARFVQHLARSSRRWAPAASALIVNVSHRFVEDSPIEYSEFADYDLGQAVAHLTVQAQAMGLSCRQFRAFDLDALSAELGLSPGWFIVSMTAIGVAVETADGARERRSVHRLRTEPLA